MVGNLHHNNSCRAYFMGGRLVGWGPAIHLKLESASGDWRSSGEKGCGINEEWFQSIDLGCWWFSDVRSVTLFPRKVKDVISAHCSHLKYHHVFEVKSCSNTLWYTRNGISPSLTGSICSNSGFSSFPSMLEKTGSFSSWKTTHLPPRLFPGDHWTFRFGGFSNSQAIIIIFTSLTHQGGRLFSPGKPLQNSHEFFFQLPKGSLRKIQEPRG